MRPKFSALSTIAFLAILTGCAGEGHGGTPPTNAALSNSSRTGVAFRRVSQSIRSGDALAAPYTAGVSGYVPQPVSFSNAFTTTESKLTSPHYLAIVNFLKSARSFREGNRRPEATTNSDDSGGQAGLLITATSSNGNDGFTQNGDGSVWDAMSYNFEDAISVDPPNDSYGNYLYAPTTHGPNGNCLESTVDYFDNTASFGTYFLISDWCIHPGSITFYHVPIDDNFVQNYVEVYTNGDGDPEFQEEVYRDSNNKWHQLLFNNLSQVYQDIYDTTGVNYISGDGDGAALGYTGWNIFETHFSYDTTCPSFSQISASGLRVQTSNDGENGKNWGYVPNYSFYNSNGDCFNPNNFDFYTIRENTGDLGWFSDDPPACQPDSLGNCAALTASTLTGTCRLGTGPHGQPINVYAYRLTYGIWIKEVLAESATNAETVGASPPCTVTAHWSPNEPKTAYNDPGLP